MEFIKFGDNSAWEGAAKLVKFGEQQWYTVILIELVILISLATWRILLEDGDAEVPAEKPSAVVAPASVSAPKSSGVPLESEEDLEVEERSHQKSPDSNIRQRSGSNAASRGRSTAPRTAASPATDRRSGRSRTPSKQHGSPSPVRSNQKSGKRYDTRGVGTPNRLLAFDRSPTPTKRTRK